MCVLLYMPCKIVLISPSIPRFFCIKQCLLLSYSSQRSKVHHRETHVWIARHEDYFLRSLNYHDVIMVTRQFTSNMPTQIDIFHFTTLLWEIFERNYSISLALIFVIFLYFFHALANWRSEDKFSKKRFSISFFLRDRASFLGILHHQHVMCAYYFLKYFAMGEPCFETKIRGGWYKKAHFGIEGDIYDAFFLLYILICDGSY